MRGLATKTILAAALAGTNVLAGASANAHDSWDRWDDRWEHRHRYKHGHYRYYDPPRRVIVERPVIVERTRPVMVVPAYPVYSVPPADPSLNFNFSFPMR